MYKPISIAVPQRLGIADLPAFIKGQPAHWYAAFDLTPNIPDRRAELKSVDIVEVAVTESQVSISYRVTLATFAPCQDQHYSQQLSRRIVGRFENGHVIFDKLQLDEEDVR
jgi:hypothetical protein